MDENKYNIAKLSRQERIGLVILLFIIAALLTLRLGFKKLYLPEVKDYSHIIDTVTFIDLRDSFNNNKAWAKTKDRPISYTKPKTTHNKLKPNRVEKEKPILFPFDPNTLSRDSLMLLGIPNHVVNIIINFRKKGRIENTDMLFNTIYGFDQLDTTALRNYVHIPQLKSTRRDTSSNRLYKNNTLALHSIELNTCDTIELTKISGIGPYYAREIIKKRNSLGGIYDCNQLSDIYKMRSSLIDTIRNYTWIDSSAIVKLNINTLDQDALYKHPYISYKQANIIVNYRKQHGTYKDVKTLIKIPILKKAWLQQVQPYLSLE